MTAALAKILGSIPRTQVAGISQTHANAYREWRKALRKARAPGFGVFGGVGYTSSGEVQGVVGVGLVFKIW